jgi:hypothetical protein
MSICMVHPKKQLKWIFIKFYDLGEGSECSLFYLILIYIIYHSLHGNQIEFYYFYKKMTRVEYGLVRKSLSHSDLLSILTHDLYVSKYGK